MTAINPSNAFQARCSVGHVPPADPFFITNRGFKSVTVDRSVLPSGGYILELEEVNMNMNVNMISGQYHSQSENDLGVLFFGHLGGVDPQNPFDIGRFSMVRFQVLPGNIPIDGAFLITVTNCQ
jgi:hypothetical protein